MDFGSFENDLTELRSDPKVRQALESGVELVSYAAEIEKELEDLVKDSIPDYVKEAPETAALNNDIEACDNVLSSIENILHEFQRDLGGISEEMTVLQEKSLNMGVKLKNLRDIDLRVRLFLEKIAVTESLVRDICEKEVNEEYCQVTLKRLVEHINFAREREVIRLPVSNKTFTEKLNESEDSAKKKNSIDIVPILIPPELTAAAQDVIPEFEKLRLRATTKVRAFLLEKISSLKRPSTNIQMLQQHLLLFCYAYEFLYQFAPTVAEEVRNSYIESLRSIFFSLFKVYHSQLLKFTTTNASLSNPLLQLPNAQTMDVITSLQRKPDPMSLSIRIQETGKPDSPPIVTHLVQSTKKIPYEAIFRSEQKHLIDSATMEYLFILDFFGRAAANFGSSEDSTQRAKTVSNLIFEQIFSKTLQELMKQLDIFLETNQDPISQLFMIKISQDHRRTLGKRKILVLEKYFDELDQKLWPSLKRLIDANLKSLVVTDAKKLFGSSKIEITAPFWVRRYALFAANIYSLASELDEHSDGSLPRALDIARSRALDLLEKMSQLQPNAKLKSVFMINSCDAILAIFSEVGRVLPDDAQKIEEVLNHNIRVYIDEELSEWFGKLIKFVRLYEKTGANAKLEDKDVKDLVIEFATSWRSGFDGIKKNIAMNFPSFVTGKDILASCLKQLCEYYSKFRLIVQDRAVVKTSKTAKLVEMSTLFAEIEVISRTLAN